MSLIEITFAKAARALLDQSATMVRNRADIERFEELCAVLRSQGSVFTEQLDADADEINYHIYPADHGDYIAIVEALCGMGAHRTQSGSGCDIVNPEPDAPMFWLHIPPTN